MDSRGRLSPSEQIVYLGRAALGRLRLLGPRPGPIDQPLVELPDTPLVRWARQHLERTSPDWLVNHGLRTYLWGTYLARARGVAFDAEATAVAALLHDLGLTGEHAPASGTCFAVHGAREAERLLAGQGVSEERRARIGAAISRHLDVAVGPSAPEAHAVQAGAACDVIGSRFSEIARPRRAEVLARHPRLQFRRQVRAALGSAGRQRGTRMWLLCWVGFLGMIDRAPFDE